MPTYITPRGHKVLVEEYEYLMLKERPRMTREVQYAASLGDRSDNAEYQYGKQRLREIDRRLRYLQKRLDNVEIVDPSEYKGEAVVRFGATVVVADEAGVEQTYEILGFDEIDANAGRISYEAPLGKALIGRVEGDEVVFAAPGGRRILEIVDVRYPGS